MEASSYVHCKPIAYVLSRRETSVSQPLSIGNTKPLCSPPIGASQQAARQRPPQATGSPLPSRARAPAAGQRWTPPAGRGTAAACRCRSSRQGGRGPSDGQWPRGAESNAMRTFKRLRKKLMQKLLQRCRRCGGAVAETGAHDGTASTSERLVYTRAGVQHAAKTRGAAHEQPWDALRVRVGCRTVSP